MGDFADGETFLMQGSGAQPYELNNTGGVCNSGNQAAAVAAAAAARSHVIRPRRALGTCGASNGSHPR